MIVCFWGGGMERGLGAGEGPGWVCRIWTGGGSAPCGGPRAHVARGPGCRHRPARPAPAGRHAPTPRRGLSPAPTTATATFSSSRGVVSPRDWAVCHSRRFCVFVCADVEIESGSRVLLADAAARFAPPSRRTRAHQRGSARRFQPLTKAPLERPLPHRPTGMP